MPLVEIKDFYVLIDNKTFSDQPVKNKQETYKKLVKMLRKNNYRIGNFLDNLYHQNYYRFIDTGLSTQANTSIPQQINFVGKVEEDNVVRMLFIVEN